MWNLVLKYFQLEVNYLTFLIFLIFLICFDFLFLGFLGFLDFLDFLIFFVEFLVSIIFCSSGTGCAIDLGSSWQVSVSCFLDSVFCPVIVPTVTRFQFSSFLFGYTTTVQQSDNNSTSSTSVTVSRSASARRQLRHLHCSRRSRNIMGNTRPTKVLGSRRTECLYDALCFLTKGNCESEVIFDISSYITWICGYKVKTVWKLIVVKG